MPRPELKRINLNLSIPLLNELDNYADVMGVPRSSAISILLWQSLTAQTGMKTLKDIVDLANANNGKLPEEFGKFMEMAEGER